MSADQEWFQGYGVAVPVAVVTARHSWQTDMIHAVVIAAFAWACVCIACSLLAHGAIRWWKR